MEGNVGLRTEPAKKHPQRWYGRDSLPSPAIHRTPLKTPNATCCWANNRLSPRDIHRLHASVTGRVVRISRRGTRFMGSQHTAIHSRLDVMTENDRVGASGGLWACVQCSTSSLK